MSNRSGTRRRSTLKVAALMALVAGAVFAAVAPGLFMIGPQMSNIVVSAELATGASLEAQNGWILPATFSVTVFSLVVGGAVALTRVPAARSAAHLRARSSQRPTPVAFQLSQPERALTVRIDRLPGITE